MVDSVHVGKPLKIRVEEERTKCGTTDTTLRTVDRWMLGRKIRTPEKS